MNYEYLVIVGITVMLLLIISFLLSFNLSQRKKYQYRQQVQQLHEEQQNQLIEAAVRSEESERHRISEELHDEVGALLSATKLFLGNILPASLNETDRVVYFKTLSLIDESINKVRSISHNMHSGILKQLGLNEALRSFIQKIGQGTSLHTTIELVDSYSAVDPDNDISIYRVIQELCNNIMKHARASHLNIHSSVTNDVLKLVIEHNGNGLNQNQFETLRYQQNGLGLKNIQNRIILLKGKISFESTPPHNTIILEIPIKAKS